MDKGYFKVLIDKEAPSDDKVVVLDQCFKNGEFINSGDIIGSIETSKATVEIVAEVKGYIYYSCKLNEEIKVGAIFAYISHEKNFSIPKQKEQTDVELNTDILFSSKAKAILINKGIDFEVFKGYGVVREVDVLEYLKSLKGNKKTIDKFNNNDVVILGGGGHSRMCLDVIQSNNDYSFAGFVDDNPKAIIRKGFRPIGSISELRTFLNQNLQNLILGIGYLKNMQKRFQLYNELVGMGFSFPTIIHKDSIIEASATIGTGNQIFAGSIIGSDVVIGENCIINSGAIISHDCEIKDNVHITPGAILGGEVVVGENTIIGMGCSILFGVKIGRNVIINNGHTVYKDIPDNTVLK